MSQLRPTVGQLGGRLSAARSAAAPQAFAPQVDEYRLPLLAAAGSGICAALLIRFAPAGIDLAAHVYQRELLVRHGFVLWNNFWYAGRYTFVTYSLLYYPLAALVGISMLAVGSIALGAFAFALIACREWGHSARLASLAFALVWSGIVVSAAFPFALGFALAMLALVALQRGARVRMGACAALSLAASPLAFLFLVVVAAATAIAQRPRLREAAWPAATLVGLGLTELLLHRLFPDRGRYPFPVASLAAVGLFCLGGLALTVRIERARLLCAFFGVYLAVALVTFVLPSPIGENVTRLRYVALPVALLTLALRRWRPLLPGILAVALAASWNVSPLAAFVGSGGDPTAHATFWRPAIRFLRTHGVAGYRVEVVDTSGHWGAVYLPEAGIPVVRGWFRQDDFPLNSVLYRRLSVAGYLDWLHRLAVRYVLLPEGPRDYSARREAQLVRSGHAGLRLVWRSSTAAIYSVPQPHALVSGPTPAKVLEITPTHVRAFLRAAGRYTVALRPSPYWRVTSGCLTASRDGLLWLTVARPGLVNLSFSITRSALGDALVGDFESCARRASAHDARNPRAAQSAGSRAVRPRRRTMSRTATSATRAKTAYST